MDFHLNEDQQAFADSARSLFTDYCSDDALRAHDAGAAPYMQALWAQCVATGLHSIVVDEAAGGLGQGMTELMAVLEPQGRALALVPLAEHQLAVTAVARFAPAAVAGVLPRLVSGEALATLALDGLSTARGPRLQARRQGGGLRLDGVVAAVPLAAQSALALLPVSFEGQPRLVAANPQSAGVGRVDGHSQRHLAVADLRFDGLHVDEAVLLAPEAQAWLEPRASAALAALQLGVSAGQMARTVEYVSQRKQFGRVIGSFQLVAGQMADAQIAVEALRSALAQLVYRLDAGLGAMPQALSVQVLAARAAHLVGHKAQHVHGGMGVDVTYPIHRYLYWSRALAASLGGDAPALERLGDWLAADDRLGWKYDLPEDLGTPTGDRHAD
ncbi:MAG: acyl-CoA/acyl-ACP dehydrogenase [Rubrivivax sp.]|jgi:alkylation response protein AidB-like acyl-CoA dehydrogenase|nr:acyl-CoA/acyl-ACP dehydrogenase [Rubrivivax sp.]